MLRGIGERSRTHVNYVRVQEGTKEQNLHGAFCYFLPGRDIDPVSREVSCIMPLRKARPQAHSSIYNAPEQ